MQLPFGKYRGHFVSEVPTEYLRWVLAHMDINGTLRRSIEYEVRRRRPYFSSRFFIPPVSPIDRDTDLRSFKEDYRLKVRTALKTAYREMALRYHPDRGGSHEAMLAVNDLYERFNALIDAAGAAVDSR
jgi:Putative quorum-sensing-regulated virulence factor